MKLLEKIWELTEEYGLVFVAIVSIVGFAVTVSILVERSDRPVRAGTVAEDCLACYPMPCGSCRYSLLMRDGKIHVCPPFEDAVGRLVPGCGHDCVELETWYRQTTGRSLCPEETEP